MKNYEEKIELFNDKIINLLTNIKSIDYSNNARRLLLLTAVVESQCFKFTRQNVEYFNPKKHGISYFQIEYKTVKDTYDNYLRYRPKMLDEFLSFSKYNSYNPDLIYAELEENINLSIFLARIKYYRAPELLPKNVYGCAEYWKKYYNTYKGKGTVKHFLELVAYYFDEKLKNKNGE